mgnify:CR=1 FL=1
MPSTVPLSMPLEERRQRHSANFKVLVRNDLSHWAGRFLRMLEPPEDEIDVAHRWCARRAPAER